MISTLAGGVTGYFATSGALVAGPAALGATPTLGAAAGYAGAIIGGPAAIAAAGGAGAAYLGYSGGAALANYTSGGARRAGGAVDVSAITGGNQPSTPTQSIPNIVAPSTPGGHPGRGTTRQTIVYTGSGGQQTNVNNRTSQNPHGPTFTPPPTQRPNVPNPGAPSPGTNPDDTARPGSTPTTPGSTGPGTRPTNTKPTTGTAPAEDKSTAPPVATRENPFDTTFYTESQREELNTSLETFYEDYAERLGSGAAAFNTFIGSPGVSYGLIDAKSETAEAGGHTHTTSGTMLTTGGSGLMGVQQPSFALMWLIKT